MSASPNREAVLLSVTDGVAHIELNRPDTSNALDMNLACEFARSVENIAADPRVRSVLISGRGRLFCPGGDVAAMAAAEDPSQYLLDLTSAMHPAFLTLAELPIPVVAAVQGAAAGAGLALTLVADIVVAAESARFLTAYGSIGVSPDCGLSWFLPQVVGLRRALELSLCERKLSAVEAIDLGLVTSVASDIELQDEAKRIAKKLADGPADAHGAVRKLMRAWSNGSLADHLDDEARSISALAATEEARALISGFAIGRPG